MRSPGASRIIHTRTRSSSDSKVEPTHGLWLRSSRSNSAAIEAGQADLSARSVDFSSMLRAMAFLRGFWAQYRKALPPLKYPSENRITKPYAEATPRAGDRRLD